MADVRVLGATVSAGRIEALRVALPGLPARTVDRATTLRWLKDGHSFVPIVAGVRGTALQLVEAGEEWFVRTDNAAEAADRLPELPGA